MHGFAIDVTSFDDGCDADGGAASADRIVEDGGFAAVLGPLCSNAAKAALPRFEEAGIVVVSPSATGQDLGRLGPSTFNRVLLDDDQLTKAGAELADVDALPGVGDLYETVRKRAGAVPADAYRPFIAYGHDAAKLLFRALDTVAVVRSDGSLQIDRRALAEAIRSTSDFVGLTGTITIDPDGNRKP